LTVNVPWLSMAERIVRGPPDPALEVIVAPAAFTSVPVFTERTAPNPPPLLVRSSVPLFVKPFATSSVALALVFEPSTRVRAPAVVASV
jgi:hypothetical protein